MSLELEDVLIPRLTGTAQLWTARGPIVHDTLDLARHVPLDS